MNLIRFFDSYLLAFTRRYLNRKEDKIYPKDELTYIAEIGKESELREAMDAKKTFSFFGINKK